MSEPVGHSNHLHMKREENFIVWQSLVRKETTVIETKASCICQSMKPPFFYVNITGGVVNKERRTP